MTARRAALLAAVLPAALPAGASAEVAHTSARMRVVDGLAVSRLEVAADRAGDGVRARISLRASLAAGQRPRTIVLRAGPCLRGGPALPDCPPAISLRLRVNPGKTVRFARRLWVGRPRLDAIRVSVTKPGALVRAGRTRPRDAYADVVLGGAAWRELRLRPFGLTSTRTAGVVIARAGAEGAQLGSDRLRPTLGWAATSAFADQPVETLVAACGVDPDCSPGVEAGTLAKDAETTYGAAPMLDRGEATTYAFALRLTGGATLFQIVLPYPG